MGLPLTIWTKTSRAIPDNIASIRVLEKFKKDGIAKGNLRINGKWTDHHYLLSSTAWKIKIEA